METIQFPMDVLDSNPAVTCAQLDLYARFTRESVAQLGAELHEALEQLHECLHSDVSDIQAELAEIAEQNKRIMALLIASVGQAARDQFSRDMTLLQADI